MDKAIARTDVKIALARNNMTMTDLVNILNKKTGNIQTVQNLSNKLSKGTLRYWEVIEIAEALGYKIEWVKKRIKKSGRLQGL